MRRNGRRKSIRNFEDVKRSNETVVFSSLTSLSDLRNREEKKRKMKGSVEVGLMLIRVLER